MIKVLARGALLSVLMASAAGCAFAQVAATTPAAVRAALDTQPTARGEAGKGVVVLTAQGPRIVATAGLGGIEVYDAAGRRLSSTPAGEAGSLDVRYDVAGQTGPVIVASDTTTNSLRFFALDDAALTEIGQPVPLGFAIEGVCLLRNTSDAGLYVIAVGDGGEVDQSLVYADASGKLTARQSRRIGLPSPAEHCVADDASGHIYVSEQAVGLWRFDGDPEADATPTLIDAPR
ncbi:MAG: phytase, partial [Brevundimonas sp.]